MPTKRSRYGLVLPPDQDALFQAFWDAARGCNCHVVRKALKAATGRWLVHWGTPTYRVAWAYAKGELEVDLEKFSRAVRELQAGAVEPAT